MNHGGTCMINKSLQIDKPLSRRIYDQGMPELSPGEVLIRVRTSGICGTDIHIYEGSYMGNYPVIPGHEFSGIVEEVGMSVSRIKKGDAVAVEPNIPCNNCRLCLQNKQNFCDNWQATGVTLPGGMAWYVKAPEPAVFPIGDISFEEGAFMEPLSCVLHGIGKLNLSSGQSVLVIGAGPIGLLLYQVLAIKGCTDISIVEINEKRRDFAAGFITGNMPPGTSPPGVKKIYNTIDDIQNKSFDVIIDATGIVVVMSQTIGLAAPGAQILLFGVPPMGETLSLDAFTIFRKGLTIVSSFTSVRNSLEALALIQSGRINVKDLISHRLSLEDFIRGIELIKDKNEMTMKVMIIP
jgi:D-arabinitol dehydrogenase (NADP+)